MRIFSRFAFVALAAFTVGCSSDAPLAPASTPTLDATLSKGGDSDGREKDQLTVMSRNLYLGASLDPLFVAPNPLLLFDAVSTAWSTVQATDFRERAEALADEIAAAKPGLVGLQEVALFRTQTPGDSYLPTATPAMTVAYDFLAILQRALRKRNLEYDAVSVVTNTDAEALALPLGQPLSAGTDVRYTDRDVILARRDVKVTRSRSGNYTARLSATLGGIVPLDLPRGWTMVDVKHRGESFRFVNTHLENAVRPIQEAQGRELVDLLESSHGRVILVGDLNSPADKSAEAPGFTLTYGYMVAAGFSDTWRVLRSGQAGFTCCQSEKLRNATSELTDRIDLVLVRGAVGPVAIRRVGYEPSDRTPSGLWPSDHAGVVARVRLPKHEDQEQDHD